MILSTPEIEAEARRNNPKGLRWTEMTPEQKAESNRKEQEQLAKAEKPEEIKQESSIAPQLA